MLLAAHIMAVTIEFHSRTYLGNWRLLIRHNNIMSILLVILMLVYVYCNLWKYLIHHFAYA